MYSVPPYGVLGQQAIAELWRNVGGNCCASLQKGSVGALAHMPFSVARVAPAETAEEAPPQALDAEPHRSPSDYEAPHEDLLNNAWDTSLLPDDETGPLGALVLYLKRGTDLISADRNGLSDPFCVVRVHKATVPSWRSRVRTKTLNPVWEQSHEFVGYLEDMVSKPIRIKVWDWDVLSLNDPIGSCQIDVSALTRVGYGAEHALHFDDITLDGVSHGRISFSVHFELKPVLRLFPGTPLHASAAQALFRIPPADATRLELFRDGLLRILSRKVHGACGGVARAGLGGTARRAPSASVKGTWVGGCGARLATLLGRDG